MRTQWVDPSTRAQKPKNPTTKAQPKTALGLFGFHPHVWDELQGGLLRDLHLLMFSCCFPHARQPLGHALLALRRLRVRLVSVLLDQRPSLLALRQRFSVFVRVIHR